MTRWRDEAACKGMDPAIFFPDDSAVETHREAKAVCRRCAVRLVCLDVHIGEHYGVFGGLTPLERKVARRRRRRRVA